MVLKENKKRTKLGNCPIGLFIFDGELCIKTEYYTKNEPDCYIISSGEYFCGGQNRKVELSELMVTPIKIDYTFFSKIQKSIDKINNLEINEVSKKGAISALKLVLNEQ